MTSNRPVIFRASDNPYPKFPFDNKFIYDDSKEHDDCPYCKQPYSEHNDREIVKCALAELRGEKS